MVRLLFLLALGLVAGTEAGLLGAKECTYGPSFWCGSLQKAKHCGAVKHCIQTVWETQVLPVDNDFVCGTCKDMVKTARQQLESKDFQNTITEVVRKTCVLIPLKEIQKDCLKIADEYIPEFIDMLVSQMNPEIICATVGLCNSVSIDKRLAVMVPENIPNIHSQHYCKDCKVFVDEIKQAIEKTPKQQVLYQLLGICGRLDSLSDGCKFAVESNFDAIYDFLTNDVNGPEVCNLLGFCSKLLGARLTKLPASSGDKPCDFCEGIVEHWKDIITTKTTKEEFKQILDGVCQQTGGFRQQCLSLVDQYYEALYQILISEIQPKQICEAAGLCGKTSVFNNDYAVWTLFNIKPSDHLPMVPLESSVDMNSIVGRDEANSYKKDIDTVSMGETGVMTQNKDSNECVMCEFVMHYLQNVLQDRPTRKEIIQLLDSVCAKLPHSVSEQCQDYVEAYGDEVIQLIILEIDPSTVCPLLHFCPSKMTAVKGDAPKVPCVMCEFAMTQIDDMLQEKKTEEEVRTALEQLCKVMPRSVEADCRNFVDQYTDQIIAMLISDFTPDQICQELGLCKPRKIPIPELTAANAQLPLSRMFIKPVKKVTALQSFHQSTGCAICEFVLHELDKFLVFPAVEADITKAVEQVCFVLPNTLVKDCTKFIEVYSEELIALLVKEIKPDVLCSAVRLCKPTNEFESMKPQIVQPQKRQLVGARKCTWGPGYWCQTKETASECGATKHCIQHVWKDKKGLN